MFKKRLKFKLFLLSSLPVAFFIGLRLIESSNQKAVVGIKYKYLTKNPFKSIYFACLSMAAEASTGILSFYTIQRENLNMSMLIVDMNAEFTKKAVGKIKFTCDAGEELTAALKKAYSTREAVLIPVKSIGVDEKGDEVAVFTFNWSFKARGN